MLSLDEGSHSFSYFYSPLDRSTVVLLSPRCSAAFRLYNGNTSNSLKRLEIPGENNEQERSGGNRTKATSSEGIFYIQSIQQSVSIRNIEFLICQWFQSPVTLEIHDSTVIQPKKIDLFFTRTDLMVRKCFPNLKFLSTPSLKTAQRTHETRQELISLQEKQKLEHRTISWKKKQFCYLFLHPHNPPILIWPLYTRNGGKAPERSIFSPRSVLKCTK